MTNSTVGALNVKISADSKELKKGLKNAGEAIQESDKRLQSSTVEFNKWGAAGALAAAGIATAIVKSSLTSIQELKNTAYAANTTVAAFERGAFAAEQFGISQEKYGDILKDVNDRVGDFLTTGGGPMVDFFEQVAPKIGITADAFKGLSGQQSLGLFVQSLQKANLSQEEMTFYMEAMASDSTRLIPLLKDNAKQLKAMDKQARALGIGLSDIDVAKAEAASNELKKASALVDSLVSQAVIEIAPTISGIAESFADMAEEAGGASMMVKGAIEDVANVLEAVLIVAIGRYTGATIAATAATIANTIATAKNAAAKAAQGAATTGATGQLAGYAVAQTTATRAAVAGTVAMTGLRGAMAFLGGPVGVAITAALALYSFVDSASDAEKQSKLTGLEVDELTHKYNKLSQAARAATLNNLNNEMQTLRGESAELTAELIEVNKRLEKESGGQLFSSAAARAAILEKRLKDNNKELDLLSEKQSLLIKPVDTSGFKANQKGGDTSSSEQEQQYSKEFINSLKDRFKAAEFLENERYKKELEKLRVNYKDKNNLTAAEQAKETALFAAHQTRLKSIRSSDNDFVNALKDQFKSEAQLETERYNSQLARLQSTYADKNNLTAEQQKLEADMLTAHQANIKEIEGADGAYIEKLKARFASAEELEQQRYNSEIEQLAAHYAKKGELTAEQIAQQNELEQQLLSEHTLAMIEIRAAAEPREEGIPLLEALGIQYATEEMMLIEKLAREQELLDQALANRKISEEDYNNETLRITRTSEEAKRKILVSNLQAGFAALTANSKKMQKIQKAAAIVQAVIAGKQAVIEAYRSGMQTQGPWAPAVAAAYSAAALANTASQIASIKSGGKSMSGAGGGRSAPVPSGGSMGGGSSSGSTQTAQNSPRNVSISLQGQGLLSTDQVRGLIEQINDAVGDGVNLITGV